jgi:D-alanine-D-alanine ligase
MRKTNQHIEIVSSSVTGLSSMSQKSRLAVRDALAKHYTKVGITIVNNVSDLEELVACRPDLVFLGMKYVPAAGRYGQHDAEKIWLSEYLEEHDIAYTGSDHAAHELELDKSLAKYRMLEEGLATSPFVVAKLNSRLSREDINLRFPVFIKPIDRGGGAGIDSASLAHNFEELQTKVASISNSFHADSLIEEYLPGKEFSVAILKDYSTDAYEALPLELIAPRDKNGGRFLSSKIKAADLETHKAVTESATRQQVMELAINAFHALGARDYGRIDIRLDESGTAHFLEANLIPSLIKDYGNFPKACSVNRQMDYETMLLRIVDLAFARTSNVHAFEFSRELSMSPLKALPEFV